MNSTTVSIEAHDLAKRFGKFTALDSVDLVIEQGIIYGLLGPSGSGKTTIIRILLRLLKPDHGTLRLLGRDSLTRKNLYDIGYMPQETALYQDLTVAQNIRLFGELYGMTARRIEEEKARLLDVIDLTQWEHELVTNLSTGMKRRVSLACSMVHKPRLLFLDEPTAGVDPILRKTFWDYFHGLKQQGATLLITTHYMDEARRCDKIGLLREGKMIREDVPEEIIRSAGAADLEEAFVLLSRGGTVS